MCSLHCCDRYGNRTLSGSGTGINNQQFAVNSSSNRLGVPAGQSGVMQYDANGNLTNDTYSGTGARSYDAENRMVSATNAGSQQSLYTYDGDGRRVRRNSYTQEVWQAYGMDGELLAEYAANAAPAQPQKEYGYRNGELLMTAAPSVPVNLALNKATTQSSEAYGGVSARAVDGNTSGNWADATVTHTNVEGEPWWQVDLGSQQSIQSIEVWNRTDCCSERLTNFNVIVLDQNQSVVASFNTSGQAGRPTSLSVNQAGRYVKVQLVNFNALSLAEVQVWGPGGGAGGAGGATDVEWIVSDQLGTPRMVVDQSGARAGVKRHDYLPFGEELFAGSGGRTMSQGYSVSDGVRQKFTKYERDDETGLDYAQARYYASLQGRFTSVDPLLASGRTVNPKTWNRYTYALNNPLRFVDPDGLDSQDTHEDVMRRIRERQRNQPIETTQTPIATEIQLRPLQNPIVRGATPEQTRLIGAGYAEASSRMQSGRCADFFGGADNGMQALYSLNPSIDPNMNPSGHPQGQMMLDGLHINPHGSSGFLTPDDSSSTFFIYTDNGLQEIDLSGAQARAFALSHETAHNTNSFGDTDNDAVTDSTNPATYIPNYINNGKIWKACFSEVKPRRPTSTPFPGATLP